MAGFTPSTDFPTTSGAYDTTHDGALTDVFVSRLLPVPIGRTALLYSTFLGGSSYDHGDAVSIDAFGVITVAGTTDSTNFPTTSGAYDTTHNGGSGYWYGGDAFVSRLDPSKTGTAQLVYSTFLGGSEADSPGALSVDSTGAVTLAGHTWSANFPMSTGAYDTTPNGGGEAFVSRLDPRKSGSAQLVYSTFLGGIRGDSATALSVDASGVVTVAGASGSADFPTTKGAYDTTHNGNSDVFISRLDPRKSGGAQLVYSTLLGGSSSDVAWGLSVDASGVVAVAGQTGSTDYPTTSGAYDTTYNGGDAFVSRLDMGVAMYGDVHEILITTGGTQKLTVNAGKAHRNLRYWIFGSITGTRPGVNLLGVHIPLVPDVYTDVTIGSALPPIFVNFKGTLDGKGEAIASFNVPANLPVPSGFTFHHAYVVYDANGIFMASNAVPLRLR